MAWLLALAIIGQDSLRPEPVATTDIEFCRAVEETVAAFCPKASAPEPWPDIFRRMAADRWRDRQDASQDGAVELTGDPTAIRWLMWGRRHRDPEVAIRCNALIRRFSPCPSCHGTGLSRQWSDYPCWDCDWVAGASLVRAWLRQWSDYPCWDCDGTRTAWPFSIWD